jgi:hypothetical protein
MLERFSTIKDHNLSERAAKVALLAPLGGERLKQAIARIDFALSPGGQEDQYAWYPLAKGVAEYRVAESGADPDGYARAVEWLTRSNNVKPLPAYVVAADFYLSMAYHRINRPTDARAAFDAAVRLAEAKLPKPGNDDLDLPETSGVERTGSWPRSPAEKQRLYCAGSPVRH